MTIVRKPGTVAGATPRREPSTREKLQADYDKLPQSVRNQVDAAGVDSSGVRTIHNTDGRAVEVATTKIQVRGIEAGMEKANREFAEAHAELAKAEPGSPEAKRAAMKIATIEQSARFQQSRNAEAAREAAEADDQEAANLALDAELIDERSRLNIINERREHYGLAPLKAAPEKE